MAERVSKTILVITTVQQSGIFTKALCETLPPGTRFLLVSDKDDLSKALATNVVDGAVIGMMHDGRQLVRDLALAAYYFPIIVVSGSATYNESVLKGGARVAVHSIEEMASAIKKEVFK